MIRKIQRDILKKFKLKGAKTNNVGTEHSTFQKNTPLTSGEKMILSTKEKNSEDSRANYEKKKTNKHYLAPRVCKKWKETLTLLIILSYYDFINTNNSQNELHVLRTKFPNLLLKPTQDLHSTRENTEQRNNSRDSPLIRALSQNAVLNRIGRMTKRHKCSCFH
jgi:hypothetical protein